VKKFNAHKYECVLNWINVEKLWNLNKKFKNLLNKRPYILIYDYVDVSILKSV
jgi:hypothetical protein